MDDKIAYQVDERTTRTVVRMSGVLVLTNIETVKKPFMDILEKDNKEVVFDLSELSHIDSSGIGLLIQIHRKSTAAAKSCLIANSKDHVASVFKSAGLDKMLNMVNDPDL